jgi:hypothetical protein
MKTPLFSPVLMIVAALAATPALAQVRTPTMAPRVGAAPPVLPHIPSAVTPLTSPATSPLQQQEQQDYATQLRGAQQQLLMQNPSGLGRGEENINRQLNGFTPQ